MSDLRNQIFAVDDIQKERITVPEWGGVELELRSMSGDERAAMLEAAADEEGKVAFASFYPRLIIHCAFDPATGEKVFTADDEKALRARNGAVLDTIADVAMRLSGISKAGSDEVGKDSDSPPSDSSTTS